jgi:cysteine desulfurase
MIYLDHAATTPVLPAALEAAWPYLTGEFGNPSSSHELGHRAAGALEDARTRVARALGARASEVIFTSGGTEGDNAALVGLALGAPRGKHIISTRTEHEAILATLDYLERVHGFEISWLSVTRAGEISLDEVRATLREDTTLVTLMLANNEIGTLHPIADVAELAHAVGARVHSDAVQAVGWLPVNFADLGVDVLSISGHKIGAPKGSGALLVRGGVPFEPLLHGGGQERDLRSGTENVAWAVALATAVEHVVSIRAARYSTGDNDARYSTGDELIAGVLEAIPTARLTGPAVSTSSINGDRHPGICSFVFPGVNGETLLLELEQRGVIVSSGAACAAGKDDPSHVLLACGYDEDTARTSVRFSLSHTTSSEDIASAVQALTNAHAAVSALGA